MADPVDTRGQHTHRVIKLDNLEIDLDRQLVLRGGEAVSLTRTEWLLLQHLAANAGKVLLNAELLSEVWGPGVPERPAVPPGVGLALAPQA